jgi:hypothetical protein
MPDTTKLMLEAARAFLAALSPEQRGRTVFPFADEERFTWHFTPVPRRGLPLRALNPAQKLLAHALISSGYSPAGARKAATIMSLEEVLDQYETERRFVRDPELYFLTVFGEPSPRETWGWRLEGHHVSLNVTVADGERLASTPHFFGANPAEVRDGPRAGLRVLAAEEDLARTLVRSLATAGQTRALLSPDAPADILTFNHRRAEPLGNGGVPAAAMTAEQRGLLLALLEEHAASLSAEIATARLVEIAATAPEELRFAWAGGLEPGQGHYYRVQAPTFLVEYDNTQNDANHIHSVWRQFDGDWGLDLLGAHLREAHAV